jgi:molecular chaperone GrpE
VEFASMMNDESKAAEAPINDNAAPGDGAADGVEERLARAEAEVAEYKDRALRALAEVENVRRRGQREREDATKFAIGNFAKDLLSVADNLRRAIESVPEGELRDEAMRNLLAGVAATERELLAAFERHGIRRVEPQPGERFDHNFHEAMFEVENTGQPGGAIVQVLQPGYVMHDRLLRPAMVGVAKSQARPEEAQRVDTVV